MMKMQAVEERFYSEYTFILLFITAERQEHKQGRDLEAVAEADTMGGTAYWFVQTVFL